MRACERNANNLKKKSDHVNDREKAALLNTTYVLLVSAKLIQSCSINYFFTCKIKCDKYTNPKSTVFDSQCVHLILAIDT